MGNNKTATAPAAAPAALKGPDNNKRLAEYEREDGRVIAHLADHGLTDLGNHSPVGALIERAKSLEAGVSSISVALAANGIVKEGELYSVFDVTISTIKFAATATEAIAALEEKAGGQIQALAEAVVAGEHEIVATETPIETAVRILSAPVGGATAGELAAIARAEAAEKRADELETQLEAANAAIDDLEAPATLPTERGAARDIGPEFGNCSAAELRAFVAEGVTFEVAFSDGERELVAFAPETLTARDLHRVGDRYGVVPALHVKLGSADPAGAQKIAGAGLLLHGEQISYCALEDVLTVNPGEERRFHSVLIFGT